jgi:hypothetical protein
MTHDIDTLLLKDTMRLENLSPNEYENIKGKKLQKNNKFLEFVVSLIYKILR